MYVFKHDTEAALRYIIFPLNVLELSFLEPNIFPNTSALVHLVNQENMLQSGENISAFFTQRGQNQCPLPANITSGLAAMRALALWTRPIVFLLTAILTYTICLVIYRMYLSPLAAFPGPFLAKTTHWYEFYHNFIRSGKYFEKIKDMHEKYGESN